MNRNALTLLGCSGSLVLMLATGNAAQANPATPLYGDAISKATPTNHQSVATSNPQTNSHYANLDPNSDKVGDLAIAKFHCDCPACRVAVVQMLQTGQLSL